MSKYIIGVDPDSDKHGIAIYQDGELVRLSSMQLLGLKGFIDSLVKTSKIDSLEIHMEDTCANNAAFKKRGVKNSKSGTAVNRGVGRCQQAQIELERLFDYCEITVVKHKISKQWKDAVYGKMMFEQATGWKGRSNEDTRSASWFGYLGTKK
jgi:hypothetical protein